MRTAVLIVVALVVLAGAGVFGLSRLVEGEDLRLRLIQEAEAVTGRDLAVEGRVDLDLLPRPTLTVAGATLGDALDTPDSLKLEVERMDLQLRPLPLLAGQVKVDAVRLVRPVLRLRETQLERSGLARLLEDGGGLPLGLLSAGRLRVIDGRATVEGGATGERRFERINLDLVAHADRGPFEIDGGFEMGARPFRLNARLGRLTDDASTTLELEVTAADVAAEPLRVAFRGVVSGDRITRTRGNVALAGADARRSIALLADALGHTVPALPAWLARPFEVTGNLASLDRQLEINELTVAFGGTEASGRLELALAAPPRIDLDLGIARLDLPDAPSDAWSAVELLRSVSTVATGEFDVTVDLLGFRGETARRLRLTAAMTDPGEVRIEQARAVLPGNGDVSFTGSLGRDGPMLQGSVTAVTDRLRMLLAWLDLEPGAVAAGRLRSLSLSSELTADPEAVRLSELEARVDGSRLEGSIAVELGERRRIAAALDLDRLDLDAYLPGATPEAAVGAVGRWLTLVDAALQLRVDRLTWRGLRWEAVVADSRGVDGRLVLKEITAEGVADSTLSLGGEIDFAAEAFALEGRLDAPRPALLLRRLGFEPPLALARLSPLALEGSARGWRDETNLDLGLELDEATLDLAGQVTWPDGAPLTYLLEAEAFHPDYGALIDALGATWQPGPEPPQGPFRLAGRLKRDRDVAFGMVGSADLGPTRITGEASVETGAARPRVDARLSLGDPALDTLLPLFEVGGMRLDPAVLSEGIIGRWPRSALDLTWLGAVDGTLEVTGKGGLADDGLELRATLDDRLLMVERLAIDGADGDVAIEASLNLRRDLPLVAIALTLSAIDPGALLETLDLAPVLNGTGEVYAEATASGWTPHALMRSLGADLRLAIEDGRLTLPEALTSDDRSAFPVEGFEGEFEMARGMLEADGVKIELGDATARVSGTVDAFLWAADLTVALVTDAAAVGRAVRIVGPLDRPQIVPLPPSTVELPARPARQQAP